MEEAAAAAVAGVARIAWDRSAAPLWRIRVATRAEATHVAEARVATSTAEAREKAAASAGVAVVAVEAAVAAAGWHRT